MGNAVKNPARFIEKKVLHEQFGLPDPKFPNKHAVPQVTDCTDWEKKKEEERLACTVPVATPLGVSVGQVIKNAKCQTRTEAKYDVCRVSKL